MGKFKKLYKAHLIIISYKSIGIFLFSFLAMHTPAFTQQETISITNYYPSPYGVYEDIETRRLAVGFPQGSVVFWDDYTTIQTSTGNIMAIGGTNEIVVTAGTAAFVTAPGGAAANIRAGNIFASDNDTAGQGIFIADAGGVLDFNDGALSLDAGGGIARVRADGGLQVRDGANASNADIFVRQIFLCP
ncbi:MAG: hypothetical protein COV72_06640 [Candidatus Omnitrophica bacterium CG11_big_fil_rev_8_21_14_0_20_42_13]|uniref:Uncharacterized protein n=1 Tax=Candidatus Ghiorseimicrobium undicola TaxID=1974746 RepID=A0A2H0LYI9_9BACT|nr:MAG: hypothetical protein COV72_06640 [Candidatus Omnitrophica bacterium CG11_big_fil_rev_8_21_14_0_20_42_13]